MCGSGAEGGRAEPCSAPLRGGGAIWLKGMVYPFKRLYNIPGPVAGARMAAWLRPPSPLPPPTLRECRGWIGGWRGGGCPRQPLPPSLSAPPPILAAAALRRPWPLPEAGARGGRRRARRHKGPTAINI